MILDPPPLPCPDLRELLFGFHPDLVLSDHQLDALDRYERMIIERNKVINLVSRKSCAELRTRHVLDSLYVLKHDFNWSQSTIVDIGSGAGFPGIVLHVALQPAHTLLIESIEKKAVFLEDVIKTLGLNHIQVYSGRSEDAAHDAEFRSQYDIAVSRAVGSVSEIVELGLPFLKVRGHLALYKSEEGLKEEKPAENALSILGGDLLESISYQLSDEETKRVLLIIKKTKETEEKYPRRAGMSKKKPL
jgi:16S rRNA (guanine527-N7)-methyltransferase